MAFTGNRLSEDVENMNVYSLRNFLISRGITVSNCKTSDLVKLAQAASTRGLPCNMDFHDDHLDLSDRLTIKGIRLLDPFLIP